MNGALAVSRYTLIEISRRRLLLVFFAIGAVGIGGLGIVLKAFTSAFVPGFSGGPGYQGPTPAQWEKLRHGRARVHGFVSEPAPETLPSDLVDPSECAADVGGVVVFHRVVAGGVSGSATPEPVIS